MKEQYKICVSGSAVDNCPPGAFKKAQEVGYQIVKQGAILTTGATTGIPDWAAKGAKKAKGTVIGLSPASTKREHLNTYRLPLRYMDLIIYTGFDYSGRNLLLTRASDAVIEICGRVGTLNEFTIAFEDKKPIGVLTGTGGTSSEIEDILNVSKRGRKDIVFDSDPERLVAKLLKILRERDRELKKTLRPQVKISLE